MSYLCKHCGNRHNMAKTALECAENAAQNKGIYPAVVELPNGHYLIELFDTNGKKFAAHIVVRQFTGTRWGGRYLVNVVNPEGVVTGVASGEQRAYLLQRIRYFGFRKAMLNFGQKTETCPVCVQKLVTQKEINHGVHDELRCYSIVFG